MIHRFKTTKIRMEAMYEFCPQKTLLNLLHVCQMMPAFLQLLQNYISQIVKEPQAKLCASVVFHMNRAHSVDGPDFILNQL